MNAVISTNAVQVKEIRNNPHTHTKHHTTIKKPFYRMARKKIFHTQTKFASFSRAMMSSSILTPFVTPLTPFVTPFASPFASVLFLALIWMPTSSSPSLTTLIL